MGFIENDVEYNDAIKRGWFTPDGIVTTEGKEAMLAIVDPRSTVLSNEDEEEER